MIPKRSLQFLVLGLLLLAAFFSGTEGNAQVRPASTTTASPDSVTVNAAADTTNAAKRGDIETTINYKAKDSIRYDAISQIMFLYGDAHIDYGEIALDAAFIQINWKTNIITAQGVQDSTGKLQQQPVFKNGAETYQAESMTYNYKTKRGRVMGAITTQGEGYIHAETIKKNELNEIYGQHAKYTTCNLEHPHFYIKATKMKVIPNDRVVAGPFHLVFADVPTPIGFPFGFFPSPRTRGSGVIIPTFGESAQLGYYLSNGGFYWAMNEYMDMRFTGDIYSLGGHAVNVQSNYTKRYKFNGSFNIRYASNKGNESIPFGRTTDQVLNLGDSKDFSLSWNHTPITLPGKGQFSANVNVSSQFANIRNPNATIQNTLSPSFYSTVSYRKSSPNSPISYDFVLAQSQTNSYDVTKPQVMTLNPQASFSVSSQSPIEWFGGTLTGRWIEGIRLGYNLRLSQNISNNVRLNGGQSYPFTNVASRDTIYPISFTNLGEIYRNSNRPTITHDIPITLGTVNLFKYFKLTPGVSYSESWFTRKYTYSSLPGSDVLKVDTLNGLHRAYQYSGNLSLTTNIYGIAQIKGKKLEAIRHTLTPSVSYNITPDFGRPEYGFYQRVQTDSLGNSRLVSRFGEGASGIPGVGFSSAIGFSIQNNVEMKVKTDSAGVFKKVSLIDAFGISGSYNMAADSFKLSTINVNLNTRLFNDFGFNLTGSFDPYQYVNGRRVSRYLLQDGGLRFARLMNLNFNTSFELNPTARKQQNTAAANTGAPQPTNLPSLQRNLTAADYVEFSIPWTMSVQFTSNFARDFSTDRLVNNATSAGINGSVTLTDKWALTYTTNYDFKNKTLSYTSLNINRDLHCWQMSISWVPLGPFQSYSININAKSSLLQDLRIRRSESATGRYR
ncbi:MULTISPECIES: putative LPS assembly protein LptD [Rufibacter]|uniref:Lipopolysaccharide assembly outer membrane protein LptD (OstA) n=1 Tax=Rufibacter quisquiliarum TaxID=1549639 RepID=A0A839GSK6_9BACT|nr:MULTISPECIES: putative LPS assembly protein LptD [Rufibacter]MBA9076791.1 lipopolysaccharide assembly outer membrane protein LptD (OstA) [Rufibacter quisquiliarum]